MHVEFPLLTAAYKLEILWEHISVAEIIKNEVYSDAIICVCAFNLREGATVLRYRQTELPVFYSFDKIALCLVFQETVTGLTIHTEERILYKQIILYMYIHAPHNDVSLNDGQRTLWWYHKIKIL